MRIRWRNRTLVAVVAAAALGCSDGTGPDGAADVAVAFRVVPGAAAPPALGAAPPRSVVVEGSNGTLVVEELYVVVAEFELKRVEDHDCDDDDACEEFEAPPTFVQVPLNGGRTVAVETTVGTGAFDELDFEIERLDDDEDAERRLLAEIRTRFPEWPRDASLLVTGTFTPSGGDPIPFRTFFEAEVEIELDLAPPVRITEGDDATFTVQLDPALWFVDGTGRVRNLALLDFDDTGRVFELEVEIENGFTKVEVDD